MNYSSEIKDNIIARIQQINDMDFLQAIQTILESSEKQLFQLSSEQEKSIAISCQEIQEGKFKDSESVISGLREWLKSE